MASQGFPTRRIATLVGVSESGYYAWRARPPSPRALRRTWLTRLIHDIHQESGSAYGYRTVRQELGDRYGVDISHTTVEHLMKQAGLRGRPGRLHEKGLREGAPAAGRRWIVDVLPFTTLAGPLYTAVVLDTASHCLIGYSTAPNAQRTLVHHALMAAFTRAAHAEPAAHTGNESLLACSFTERAGVLNCAPARGSVGDWYEHAVAKAFWDTVLRELGDAPSCWSDTHVLKDRLSTIFDRFTRQA
jgi:putative transposase